LAEVLSPFLRHAADQLKGSIDGEGDARAARRSSRFRTSVVVGDEPNITELVAMGLPPVALSAATTCV